MLRGERGGVVRKNCRSVLLMEEDEEVGNTNEELEVILKEIEN